MNTTIVFILNIRNREFRVMPSQCEPLKVANVEPGGNELQPTNSNSLDHCDLSTPENATLASIPSANQSARTHHNSSLPRSLSAQSGLTRPQRTTLMAFALLIVTIGIVDPSVALATIAVPLSFFFLAIVILRVAACRLVPNTGSAVLSKSGQENTKSNLPIYTILVPLYQEADMLPKLTKSLLNLDYPANKLDIKLIVERDDIPTKQAAYQQKLPPHFEIILVPASEPRTKPKALDYALHSARGEFITIYDAEDQPEPDQLRKCLKRFEAGPPSLACVQAKLNFYNGSENWLTRQFTIEYTALFDAFLPALERMKLPIPLGGTSNHFKTSALKKVGAWDPFNLTEDADLGMRLYRNGYQCALVDSTTYEEANCRLWSWKKQRTRWLKGWLQTYFVHMRNPITLWQELGPRGFFGFQAIIGGLIISALAHPIFYAITATNLIAANVSSNKMTLYHQPLFYLALFNLAIGYLSAMWLACSGLKLRNLRALNVSIFWLPLYWMMISLAGYRAVLQLIKAPFLWEKTKHGLTSRTAEAKLG